MKLLILGFVVAVAIIGCGDDPEPTPGPGPNPLPPLFQVSGKFLDVKGEVKAGATVTVGEAKAAVTTAVKGLEGSH